VEEARRSGAKPAAAKRGVEVLAPLRGDALVADMARRAARRFSLPLLVFVLTMATGTVGFRIVGAPDTSWVDAVYMTYLTVSTIGFHEVVDLSASPGGRLFTMAIAAVGIVNFTYIVSVMTAFLVEVDLNEAFRRRRMQKRIDGLTGHYIVGGLGRVGDNVTSELIATGRSYVAIDIDPVKLAAHRERHPEALCLQGDAGEDDVLLAAGLRRAAGVFAITGDDAKNLVIVLSARQLAPAARVVARCHDVKFVDKIRRVGADDIVSPDFTGGLRLASSMVRPHVVSFLDEMLRADKALRVEQVSVPEGFQCGPLSELALSSPEYVLLAIGERTEFGQPEWQFNPQADFVVRPGATLVVMATPEGRRALEARFAS
jgi:voltage-gated potassium channel